jgi:hypothetical protein
VNAFGANQQELQQVFFFDEIRNQISQISQIGQFIT